MKKIPFIFVTLLVLAVSTSPALAFDRSSALVDCQSIKDAATAAQHRYVQIYQPQIDPTKTFDDATASCVSTIQNVNLSIPSIWDGVLQGVANQVLNRACQAAQAQYNKAVNDAMQSVNGTLGQIPGAGVSAQYGGQPGTSPSTTVTTDNGAAMKGAATKSVDRVINFFQ